MVCIHIVNTRSDSVASSIVWEADVFADVPLQTTDRLRRGPPRCPPRVCWRGCSLSACRFTGVQVKGRPASQGDCAGWRTRKVCTTCANRMFDKGKQASSRIYSEPLGQRKAGGPWLCLMISRIVKVAIKCASWSKRSGAQLNPTNE